MLSIIVAEMVSHANAPVLRVVGVSVLVLLPMLAWTQNPDSKAITDLLKEAKKHARLAEEDAGAITYKRSYSRVQ